MKKAVLAIIAAIIFTGTSAAQPRLERIGNNARIIVNEHPMLMIGGEMGNSSASTLDDVSKHFAHLHRLGLNTVLAPVSWELIEPHEGVFDMSTVDNLLSEARKNNLKVVILWFGAWKNSMSCYAPEWFKRDTKRFPRAHTLDGLTVEEASSLSKNVLEADKIAFCKIIEYLRDNDKEQTVIMVQVENEIGMIDVPRDYSTDATRQYNKEVPKSLTKYLDKNKETLHPFIAERYKKDSKHKTWAEVFGNDIYAEEIFQAWTYASYVQELASAGRSIYNIPMYVNVALNSRGRKPGEYPSGGPLAHLIDIWHAAAPAIDVLGVDIYDAGYKDWLEKYHLHNNPLFIPEIHLEDRDAMYALYAFGHHSAMGFSPFSIEDYPLYDISAKNDVLSPIAACYSLLRQAEPLILERQGTADLEGILLSSEEREQEIITPDSIRLTIKHSYSLGWEPGSKDDTWPEAACIILRLGKEDYLVIGSGVVITYSDAKTNKRIGLAKCESVSINNGEFTVLRHLNGDQTHQGRHVRIPVGQFDIQHFRLYPY